MISFTVNLYFLFSAVFVVEGTLTPDGTGPLDCGSQRSFTCSVSDAAAWNITGLSGISLPALPTGRLIADNNGRITSTDTGGVTQSSTITITGFSTADDGGTIQCININDASVQGMASISVGTPSCPIATAAVRSDDFTSATVSWQQPSNTPVTSTTVTYCPTSSPNCGDSMTCTSPCNISGLDPCMDYSFTVIPNNNCGSATGCTGNSKNVTSQEPPSCLTSFSANRDGDFTNANVTYLLATTPPGTSTIITYCPTSSPNCQNKTCPSTGTCTISGLDPCVNYNMSAIPTNNCGSLTGCTGNSMVVAAKGTPSCPMNVKTVRDRDGGSVTVTWTQETTPPGTITEVTFSPSSNGINSTNCSTMNPCIISGLNPHTEYQFTVLSENTCGGPMSCSGKNVATSSPSIGLDLLVLLVLLVLPLIPCMYPLGVLIAWRCCYKDRSYCEVFWCCWCCGCCTKGHSGRNSTEPMKSPTGDDDAQDKSGPKEEKLTYAALEFSEQAGSTKEKKIRSQEEPVQYAAVDHA